MTLILIRACLWHGQRNAWATATRKSLPGSIIVPDRERNARATFIDALRRQGDRDAWHLEDDAFPTSDFVAKTLAEQEAHPGVVIQGYSNTKGDVEKGSRWLPGSRFFSGVCFFVPGPMAPDLLRYVEGYRDHKHGDPYYGRTLKPGRCTDPVVRDYLKEHKLRYWNRVPSLAQHRDGPTLMGVPTSRHRQSRTFVP